METVGLLTPLSVSPAYHDAPAVVSEPDFDARWAAWVARGRVHERRARRRFIVSVGAASALAFGAATIYTLLKL